jgi:hypothetical protein
LETLPRRDVHSVVRPLGAALTAGFLSGLLVGGVGGRVAMLVLRLTSDPSLRGLQTDDDFTIGVVSFATVFLLGLTAFAGALGGIVYLIVRSWLPERWRPWLFGSLTGLVGGAMVIRPGGIDFTRLEPLSLAVAMFIAIPAIYGVVTSRITERLLRRDLGGARASLAMLILIPVALIGLQGLAIVAVVVAGLVVAYRAPRFGSVLSSPLVGWLGRAALAAVGVAGTIALAKDISAVL